MLWQPNAKLCSQGDRVVNSNNHAREIQLLLHVQVCGITDWGYIGVFPAAARIGDQICAALDCPTPCYSSLVLFRSIVSW